MLERRYSERLTIAAEQNFRERDFWLNKLSGDLVKSRFPCDQKRTDAHEYNIDSLPFELDGELFSKLTELSKGSDYTLNLILITMVFILLEKYTGSNDLVVGTSIYRQEMEGDFINTALVLRSPIELNITFKDFVLVVRQTISEAVENQNYPIEILVDKLNLDTLEDGFPLFDVAVLLENIQEKKYLRDFHCNMTFLFRKTGKYVEGIIEYNTLLYEKTTIERIIDHFKRVMRQALLNVNMPLSDIEIMTEKERKQILVDFNNTTTAYPKEKPVHQWFEEQVEKTPDTIALVGSPVDEGACPRSHVLSLTYRQLSEKTNHLAGVLRARGVVPGKIAALMLDRSIRIPLGILAVLKTGSGYLPIDPEYPERRINYMLNDSHAFALLTTRDLYKDGEKVKGWKGDTPKSRSKKVHSRGDSIIFLEDFEKGANDGHHRYESIHHSENLCYIIYTSGTTGKPKGVMLEHENLVNYVNWFCRAANLTPGDKTILTSSFAFDLGYTSLYPSILTGCELHILPREIYLLAEQLLDYIRREGITYMKVTPSLFSIMVKSPDFSERMCKTLRLVAIGGEAVNVKDIEASHSICSHIRIMNHYGPTEATIGCIATFVDFDQFENYKRHPVIGTPIYNTRVYILGKDLNLLPLGVPGELCISGACLARGYMNRPELTAALFDRDLWDDQDDQEKKKGTGKEKKKGTGKKYSSTPLPLYPSTPLYHTGDLSTCLPNGNIEFLGRIDKQVKVLGYRIELEEIENRLLKHYAVEEALVMVKDPPKTGSQKGNGDKYLCAYIVPDKGVIKTPEAVPADGKILKLKEIETEEHFIKPPDEYPEFRKEYSRESIAACFQQQVEKNPDTIVVKSDGQSISYHFLDTYANQVAHTILKEYDDRYKLSTNERTRYKRQMLLYGWGMESQEKLKRAAVFVAGAGGGASPTIMQLALAGFGTIIVCDSDVVELSNLNRQVLHDETRIGMNKALSAKMTVERINPHVNVLPCPQKLTSENVCELVGDADVILDMFDDLEAKFVLSEYAAVKKIPHIISAMTDINGYAAVFHTPHTPCFHCLYDRVKFEEITEGMSQMVDKYEKNPLAVVATSLFMSSGFAVNEAIKIVLGFGNSAYNKFLLFNQRGTEALANTESYRSMTYTFSDHFRRICKEQGFDWDIGWRGNFLEELRIEPDPDCLLCGEKGKEKRKKLEAQFKKGADAIRMNIKTTHASPLEAADEKKEESARGYAKQAVALLLNNDIGMAAGILGILKSGKTYVPLEPDAPMERLAYILEDSESRIILTDDDHLNLAEKIRDKVNKNIKITNIHIDNINIKELNEGGENPGIGIKSEQAAYILYSPGPGETLEQVAESHEDVLEFVRDNAYRLQMGSTDGFNPISSYSMKTAMMDLYQVLLSGNGCYTFENNAQKITSESLSSELRNHLLEELPEYMIPSCFVRLDKLPLTPNGKVDKKALPEPGTGMGDNYTAPRNEMEVRLGEIWAQVLEIDNDRLSIDSNFFQLGGNSLKATILITRIHKAFDVKIPLGEVFKVPQLNTLAEYIDGLAKDKFISIEPAKVKDYYSLSSGQKRLYILHMMDEKSVKFNMIRAFRLEGPFDKLKVENTFKKLIQRHEGLRTSFDMIGNEPVQVIHQEVPFETEYFDLEGSGEENTGERREEAIIKAFLRSFDLSQAPLVRVGLIRIAGEKHILMIDLHHIVSDGTSMRKLTQEFGMLYAGKELPGLRLQYKDFSEWQNSLFQSGAIRKQKEYWLDRFKGEIPVLNLPLDYPRPEVYKGEGKLIGFEIESETTAAIKQLVLETNTTTFMVLMAVFNILFSKYSSQEDIVIGSPIAGRRHVDLENIIGLFANILAMRNQPKREKIFRDFLEEVKVNAFDAYENADYQFEHLVWDLNLKVDYGRNPLFDVVFVLDVHEIKKSSAEVEEEEAVDDLKVVPYGVTLEEFPHEVLLTVTESGDRILMSLEYSTELFKESTARRMTKHYMEILHQVLKNCDIKLKDIKISHELVAAKADIIPDDREDFRF